MRKIAVILGALVIGSLPACMDLKEESIAGVTRAAYGTPDTFEALVSGSYVALRDFYAQERGFTLTEFGTDIFTKGSDGSHKFFNDYTSQLNSGATYARELWDLMYRGINTANAAIEQGGAVAMDPTLRDTRVGEARFVRALYYFILVQTYGPVPLNLSETKAVTTTQTRAPVDSVYEAIIQDLTFAEAKLPAVQKDYGRVTRGAAQHLLAKVYLTRIRGADSTANEAAKTAAGDFANAATWALKVINSGQYALLPRFKDVFAFDNERNQEVIWSVQFTKDPLLNGNGNRGHLYFLMEYDAQLGMQRDIQNGRPFKRFRPTSFFLGLYDRTKDARYDAQFTRVWFANNPNTIPKDANGVPKFRVGDTAIVVLASNADTVNYRGKPYMVIPPSKYTNKLFPSLNKHHDPFRASVNQEEGSRDFFVARLAETYLIAAEALLRDGRPAEGLPYINAVRRRAAVPGQEAAMTYTLPTQLTLASVLDERARELTGEMVRWFDLVRTFTLLYRTKLYNSDAKANIQAYHMLRPIPVTQIERTSGVFPQNPGY
ncbi:MAG TPA: RagB/SusD family nutrient uptake outer membrane protein [Gemmatimonadaceae bacterium]|nr:RagB/SusD family nutrient uptake outer membrane protein [Gemmatimonadaceae bacterium]